MLVSEGQCVGLGIRDLERYGFGETTKPSLLKFPIVGRGEFTQELALGCGEDGGEFWKMPGWSFVQ